MTRGELARIFGCILLLFVLGALALSRARPRQQVTKEAAVAYSKSWKQGEFLLHAQLSAHPEDREGWLMLVSMRAHQLKHARGAPYLSESEFLAFLKQARQPPADVVRAYYIFHRDGLIAGLAELGPGQSAEQTRARIMMFLPTDPEQALNLCRAAVARHPSDEELTRRHIRLLVRAERFEQARRLLDQPRYQRAANARLRFHIYHGVRDYRPMLLALIQLEWEEVRSWLMLAGLAVGLAWMLLALHLGWSWTWPTGGHWLALSALLCGFFSAVVTIWVVVIQDDLMGTITQETSFEFNFIYCVFGIGLREELVKLLFVLPLLPFLRRGKSDLQILSIASLVGLGFAINENVGYYTRGSGGAVLGRFLTANFAHMVLTGYTGYYLVKAVQHGGEKWQWFASQSCQMILLHGLYDFFLIEPRIAEYGPFLSAMLFIWLGQIYLRLLKELAPTGRRPIPLSRLFVACMGVAIGVGYLLAVTDYGLQQGAMLTVQASLGVGIIAIMYFREFDEQID